MELTAIQLLQAFGFTMGCVAIHTLRSHADTLTEILAVLVLILGLAAAAIGIDRFQVDPGHHSDIAIDLSRML
ncbi:MAG: hypothetical protein K2Y56_13700 [Methylobacterium sp.]|uniref:hypothetical protein n=1 Tax=Methylobacterium sp. TaxID=409 RepID=UPI0025DAB103|nr:hypothetical protein [Methylobacterium sp.]MBX9932575.1 hypothetical protein [Methylobacterium sp.]